MSNSRSKQLAVIYGNHPAEMVPALLNHFDVAKRIRPGSHVGIKPNLVVSKPSESGATTDPAVIEAIIVYLKEHGIDDIRILESAWIGDDTERAFDVCGYRILEKRYGVPLLDLKQDSVHCKKGGGMRIDVCRQALAVDYLINVPVLKAHCQTRITCALKNLKGVIPDTEKQRFHAEGLHRPIAALATIVKSDFVLVDGIIGDLSHEEGGTPVAMNRLLAGDDPVLMDAFAASLLGYTVQDIPYIGLSERLGIGSADLSTCEIIPLNAPVDAPTDIRAEGVAKRYTRRIDARNACSPCIGGLIHALVRLDHHAGRLPPTICVGQGFKNRSVEVGIGTCTRHGEHTLIGCPPTAAEIVDFLKRLRLT